MGISIAVSAAILLFLAFVVWVKSALAHDERPSAASESLKREAEFESPCPPEFVAKIFAEKDQEYVSALGSPHLEKFFQQERKAVALFWVQQTSGQIGAIIRTHLQASRTSGDLELGTEAGILLRYGGLQFLCGVLFVSIELAGPQGLHGLAARADAWAQRIREAQQALHAASEAGRVHGV